jgi:hypothetical protein
VTLLLTILLLIAPADTTQATCDVPDLPGLESHYWKCTVLDTGEHWIYSDYDWVAYVLTLRGDTVAVVGSQSYDFVWVRGMDEAHTIARGTCDSFEARAESRQLDTACRLHECAMAGVSGCLFYYRDKLLEATQ